MDYLFIINPTAGKGMGLKAIPQIEAYLQQQRILGKIILTEYPGHAAEVAKAWSGTGLKAIAAAGGDGTVMETANGLLGTGTPLGIIPLGSGNDFARSLRIPHGLTRLEEALTILTEGASKPVDVGLYGDCAFLNVASIGFDSEIIRDLPKVKRIVRGPSAYIISIFLKFLTYKTKRVQLVMDGVEKEMELFLAAVCNGKYYGGGLMVNPEGSLNDGYLNLILVHPLPRLKIPFLLGRFKKGLHISLPYVETHLCKSLTLHSMEPLPVNTDGELAGETPASFRLMQHALSVIQPYYLQEVL